MDINSYIIATISILFLISALKFHRILLGKNNKQNPHDLLKNRCAAGDITTYEYEQQKRQLYRDEDLKIKTFFLASLSND
ncbi:MAG: hypothetical protein ABI448_12580 [Bacteroidia bacterium]